ncbi:MAG: putative Protein smf [Chlamydiales bacterium]|jgi:DNA processing protein|nr:putative Protein smf [Chlamydiales bacterium]
MNEIEALVVLVNTPGLGPIKARKLINYCGSALGVLNASQGTLEALPGIGEKLSAQIIQWQSNPLWKQDLDLVLKYGVDLLPSTSPQFPSALLTLVDCPILLYIKGNILPQDQNCIAVVGTRSASIYGKEQAHKFSSTLAKASYTIVSGLARGIDTAAHEGALAGQGRTLAFIGSGLANIYPRENIQLASKISTQGAVLTEFPMATSPNKQHFPQRNRLVSAICKGILLVEAPIDSGAMITMNKAQEYKKNLFTLPGRVDMESFKGNHHLLKNNTARLVEEASDILNCYEDLFPPNLFPSSNNNPKSSINLTDEEKYLLELTPSTECSFEELVLLSKFPTTKLNALLMSLQLKQAMRVYPGRIYKKV